MLLQGLGAQADWADDVPSLGTEPIIAFSWLGALAEWADDNQF